VADRSKRRGSSSRITASSPERPHSKVTRYRVQVCQCTVCGHQVRGQHAEVAPDQYGATAHRLGPRVMAVAHALHYGVGRRVCLHSVGHPEAWPASPRLAQKSWKAPLRLASHNAKTWRKPGGFPRMPARLHRLWMTCLHAPSTVPEPTASPAYQGSWYRIRVRFRSM
jgi:hypothetical protein